LNKPKLKKDLELIHRHLTRAEVVMQKIATKLDIDRHEYLEKTLYEVEELLKLFEEKDSGRIS
jgi:hypothetical protein